MSVVCRFGRYAALLEIRRDGHRIVARGDAAHIHLVVIDRRLLRLPCMLLTPLGTLLLALLVVATPALLADEQSTARPREAVAVARLKVETAVAPALVALLAATEGTRKAQVLAVLAFLRTLDRRGIHDRPFSIVSHCCLVIRS